MNSNRMEAIEERLQEVENAVFLMNTKLDRLIELVEKDCKKMSNHIDFVETVYEKVKTPFTFIMDNVNSIVYNRNQSITES